MGSKWGVSQVTGFLYQITQRSFANILEMIGTPAKSSVPRGNPKGRESGVKT